MNMDIKEQVSRIGARTVDLVSREELRARLEQARQENRPLRIKLGADPSAPDIHLGHVVVLNKLREFQDLGHRVVFIIGDFTGMIGDPSGRSQTRPALTREEIRRNAETYQDQIFRILDPEQTEVRFNSEWLSPMTFEDVVRLSARVTVAQMLARDDFAKRYSANQPISLVEFLYPLIQAYDSVMVNADVEVGGTDQLFNLLLGRELQKAMGQEPQIVLTLPLIEGIDGTQKMSKSLNNYVGITEAPSDMFGKIMSISDDLMWRYYSLVVCLPDHELDVLRNDVQAGRKHPRDVKDELARGIVARFRDEASAQKASAEFARVFSERQTPSDLPEIRIPADLLEEGRIGIGRLLIHAGLAKSNNEARRLVEQGGVRVDDEKLTDPKAQVAVRSGMILRAGKRGFAKLAL